MVRTGTAQVRLKVITSPVNPLVNPSPVTELYAVQAGAFSDPSRAEALRETLRYSDARVVERKGNPSIWRVLIGHALTIQEATALAADVAKTTGEAVVVKE
jgi:cell division septation protein DedD